MADSRFWSAWDQGAWRAQAPGGIRLWRDQSAKREHGANMWMCWPMKHAETSGLGQLMGTSECMMSPTGALGAPSPASFCLSSKLSLPLSPYASTWYTTSAPSYLLSTLLMFDYPYLSLSIYFVSLSLPLPTPAPPPINCRIRLSSDVTSLTPV